MILKIKYHMSGKYGRSILYVPVEVITYTNAVDWLTAKGRASPSDLHETIREESALG